MNSPRRCRTIGRYANNKRSIDGKRNGSAKKMQLNLTANGDGVGGDESGGAGWEIETMLVVAGGSECGGDVDGGVVMECRICGGSCGGYDVEGGDGGAAWSDSDVGGARQVA
ncbi:hypothetical protein Tco_0986925, partial [Tanacetum coccineum]